MDPVLHGLEPQFGALRRLCSEKRFETGRLISADFDGRPGRDLVNALRLPSCYDRMEVAISPAGCAVE